MSKDAQRPAEGADPTPKGASRRAGGSPPTPRPETRPGRVVAVTGSSGFLGLNLVGLLEDSDRIERVVSLDRLAPSTAGEKTRHFELDLTRGAPEEQIAEILGSEGVDTLVHLSFLGAPSHRPTLAHELESVGTMHVLNACRRTQVHKVVLWSQTFLYGARPTNPNFLSESQPLRADRSEAYFGDKMEAEADALDFGMPGRGRIVTILRTAPIVGPTIDNHVTRYLGRTHVPTILGFDPLWQFLHESDAVAAFKRAVDHDAPGIFNIAGGGVLPLSKVIRLVGRNRLPLPRPVADLLVGALWVGRSIAIPPAFLDYMQYVCVADEARARKQLGFVPMYTSREAVSDFASTQNLRDVKLLSEKPA